MNAQDHGPSDCRFWTPRRFSVSSARRLFEDIESQHCQLAVDALTTPGRVLGNLAEDEFPQLDADAFPARINLMPRKPRPIQLEPSPVPANDGFGFDENQGLLPSRPEPPQHHPKQSLRSSQSRLRTPLLESGESLRKAKFSECSSRRERKKPVGRVDRSPSREGTRPVSH